MYIFLNFAFFENEACTYFKILLFLKKIAGTFLKICVLWKIHMYIFQNFQLFKKNFLNSF